MKRLTLAALLLTAALPLAAQQPQLRTPRPSQKQIVTQTVGVTDITINYSRPGVKGRAIWGGLVPYDKVWRTGANEATSIAFSDDVTINGQALPKGTYSLHTIPSKDEWTIIFNKVAEQWGSYSYDEKADALRIKAKPEKSEFREWLTFEFPQLSVDQTTIAIRWENVSVPFTVNTDTVNKTLGNIKKAMAGSKGDAWRLPYLAAQTVFDAGATNPDAAQWIDDSLKANENINNLWLKARMQAKAGNVAEARKTGAAAIAKATPEQADFAAEIKRQMGEWK
ncbi:MAG: hypothetical protein QOI24_2702 [Acidobacteriota bacterium]|jgi:hypothetical protein|nr:hypothetical protein [Acidobacteriota bacterium]